MSFRPQQGKCEIIDGETGKAITARHGIKPDYVRRLLNAAYLAPTIKRAIFQGTQPAHLQVQDLLLPRSLDWKQQLSDLGFESEKSA